MRRVLLFAFGAMLFAGSPSGDELVGSGNAAFKRGEFLNAAEEYERAASVAPKSPEPLYNLALAYYRQGLYEPSIRYLDRAQALARGSLLGRCLLLRADIEYRHAMAENPIRQVEGLERALKLYRDALTTSGEPWLSETARYDIEVVKLRLPPARGKAPKSESDADAQRQVSADEAVAGSAGPPSRDRGKSKQQDHDW